MKVVLVLSILVLGAAPAVAREASAPAFGEYLPLVRRVFDGEDGTVLELAAWRSDRLVPLQKRLPPPDCADDCLRAAALAHTAAAFASVPQGGGRPWPEHDHLVMAEALLNVVRTGPFDAFRREWSLAVGYRYVQETHFKAAYQSFAWILYRWPDDPPALLAMGSLHELFDALPQAARSCEVEPPFLPRAEAFYRRALAQAPDHAETGLRLGRVLARQGRADGATVLRRVIAARPRAEVAAFAHLFLGNALRDAGEPESAVAAYRAALAEDPHLQPAQLSLARALHRAGRAPEAVEVVHAGLGAPAEAIHTWFGYHTSLLHGYEEIVERLRAKVAP